VIDMDGDRHDPLDDDVTVVGDHELVVELRRIAAERGPATGAPLPPPRPAAEAARSGPSEPGPRRGAGARPTERRGVPPQPRAAVDEDWWDDDDDDGAGGPMRTVLIAVLIAALVVALAVAGLFVLR
jgi:hypothetical protein